MSFGSGTSNTLGGLEALVGSAGEILPTRRALPGLVGRDLVAILAHRQVLPRSTDLLAPTAHLGLALPLLLGAPLGADLCRLGSLAWRIRGWRHRGVLQALGEPSLELGDLACPALVLLSQRRLLGDQRFERAASVVVRHARKQSNAVSFRESAGQGRTLT